jgi:hypothetical protein
MAENEELGVADAAEAELVEAPKPRRAAKKPKTKSVQSGYVDIMLEENEEIPPTGLFIGVNGRSYLLQPGSKVAVPQGIIDVLDNAIMSTPKIDPATKRVVGYKERLRYPYRRM